MKKILIYSIAFSILLLSSCSDLLDSRDTSVINPDIWDSEQSATLFLNTLYDNIPTTSTVTGSNPFGMHSNYTDESVGSSNFLIGAVTKDGIGIWNDTYYAKIRNINIAFEQMQESTMSEEAKTRIFGQLYFMRAWSYWNLVILYGGVPYVTEPVDPYIDDELTIDPPRNKTSECIQFICDDLDLAIENLPASVSEYTDGSSEYARLVRAAAAALKGRVLLFYASPQFNPNDDAKRWEDAYAANSYAKDLADQDGFGLLRTTNGTDPISGSFASIFTSEGSDNPEALFVKAYNRSVGITHSWENSVRYFEGCIDGGQGSNPSWNLVSSFPMKNGLEPDDAESGYNSTYYWLNRDPRFYATIAYNGCEWPLAGMSGTQGWTYTENSSRSSKTGFNCRKATNVTIGKEITKECGTDWIEIRYAEVLMNLAEAACKTGKQNEAIELIGQIRDRAGIDAGTDGRYGLKSSYSTGELVELIIKERFIEFAFENKRFWDMRRYKMYQNDLGTTPKLNQSQRLSLAIGIVYPPGVITPPQKQKYKDETLKAIRSTIDIDNEYSSYFTDHVSPVIGDATNVINVPENYDFFGVPTNILNRSVNIKQTLGWGDGSDDFDPYQ